MNLNLLDWSIVVFLISLMCGAAAYSRRFNKSVADFLSANRCAGRYIIGVAEGISALGAVTIIAWFEMYYEAGFTAFWWTLMIFPVNLIIALSGWVIYRFRQTRCMTLAQFLEARYSRNFRVLAGILCFISGILNFGIFPMIGARFFVYFCGLPSSVSCLGLSIPTVAIIMFVLLTISIFFTNLGGQIAVIVTDFVQGVFCNVVFIILLVFLFMKFDWSTIVEGLANAPAEASKLHPFHTSEIRSFNVWFFIITIVGLFYNNMAWQGNSAYNSSAKNPHEARMAKIIGIWRSVALVLLMIMLPVCAYVVMHHQDFAFIASAVKDSLVSIPDENLAKQMTVPIALSKIIPNGLLGALCAVVFAAFISTHDTYLHSWGSIFIQDVVLPLRKKPLSHKGHIKLLQFSIVGVALFVFLFSLFFPLKQYIFMWFAITGSIWLGGAGSVIVGGLYWKRGTTCAAYSSLIAGSLLAFIGIVMDQMWPKLYGGDPFPINGQWLYLISMIASGLIYILVSLLGPKEECNMDKLLHRGKYHVEEKDETCVIEKRGRLSRLLGINDQFTKRDKFVYFMSIGWVLTWFTVFIFGTVLNLIMKSRGVDITQASWAKFWFVVTRINFVVGIFVTIWLLLGGIKDLIYLFNKLGSVERDLTDDGTVTQKN